MREIQESCSIPIPGVPSPTTNLDSYLLFVLHGFQVVCIFGF
jgi:hypothetical protein